MRFWQRKLPVNEIRRVRYAEGDVIVLLTDEHLSEDEVLAIKRGAESVFPDARVAVLTGGLGIEVFSKFLEQKEEAYV